MLCENSYHANSFHVSAIINRPPRVVMGRGLSSCATHFDILPWLLASGTIHVLREVVYMPTFFCHLIFFHVLPGVVHPHFSGPPLLLVLFTCIFLAVSSLPFLYTWPYHLSHFGSMLASLQIKNIDVVLLGLAHLSILISVVWSFRVSYFLDYSTFRPECHGWLYFSFVDIFWSFSFIGVFLSNVQLSPGHIHYEYVVYNNVWASFCHKQTPHILEHLHANNYKCYYC